MSDRVFRSLTLAVRTKTLVRIGKHPADESPGENEESNRRDTPAVWHGWLLEEHLLPGSKF